MKTLLEGEGRDKCVPKVLTPPSCRILCALNVSGRGGVGL